MKTSLDHLPEPKQHQLKWATEIILEAASPGMIILFGSYARGDWVEELGADEFNYKYQSDFDLLVVTQTERQATVIERDRALSDRLHRTIKTPVSLIAHDIVFLNRRLRKSQYFFLDIRNEGIVLHDSGQLELAEPRELLPAERRKLAEEDFEYWFQSAVEFLDGYEHALSREFLSKAAFELHQATERFYSTILLVFTRYKPNTHDLEKLSKRVTAIEPEFLKVFPRGTDEDCRRFKLLRKAYVDGRYKPSYRITREELEWLAERVRHLQQLTESLCQREITGYTSEPCVSD